jgi:tetratricopeptide (TPR) repeat protein
VLAFEDMQWADASLRDIVEYLLGGSRDHPLLVVTHARPELLERRPTWGAGHRNFTSLYLEPLSEQAMEELLAGLVPGLSSGLRSQILARAEGVPLYAVETVRMLLDRGLLVEDGSAYRVVGEVDSLEVPETLHALVAARLDGLLPEERHLLQDASVLGKTFTPDALAALSGLERARLDELLTVLARREVLALQSDPRSPEQGQYGFLQDLLRQVAYETMPKGERRAKHLAAADQLSSTLVEEEVVEVVASHLLEAYRLDPDAADAEELRAKAQTALVQAGERAASLGALTEAQRYFEQAGELAGEPAEQAVALSRAGEMAIGAGETDHGAALFEQAIALFEAAGDTHAAARTSSLLGVVDQRAGRMEQAVERMERAYETIAGDEPDADLALLLVRLGQAQAFAGDFARAAEWTERGLDIAESLRDPEALYRGWSVRAFIISGRRPEEARALYQLSLDTALKHGLQRGASTAYGNISDLGFRQDRYADSLIHLEEMLEFARRIGLRVNEWFALSEMSYALTMLGRWDEALARFAEIPDEQLGSDTNLASPLTGVLELHLSRGDLDAARGLLARFDELGRASDLQMESAYAAATAAVKLVEGDLTGALDDAEHAFASRDTLGIASQDVKQGFWHAVETALALGRPEKADELLSVVEGYSVGLRPPFRR